MMGDKMKLVPKMYQKDIYHIKYDLGSSKLINCYLYEEFVALQCGRCGHRPLQSIRKIAYSRSVM